MTREQERLLVTVLSETLLTHLSLPDPAPDEQRDFGLVSRLYQLAGGIQDAQLRSNVQNVLARAMVGLLSR